MREKGFYYLENGEIAGMEKVSIIVPIYNSENYIGNCIKSILNQSYKNIEMILINDGSTDNSEEICQSYAKDNNNIVYIKQNNKGVSEARNLGIDVATGTYILFVDSDDIIDPNATKKMVYALERWKTQLVISCFRKIRNYDEIEKLNGSINRFKPNMILDDNEFYDNFARIFFEMQDLSLFTPWGKLYLHNILKENNIKFPPNIHYGEDMWFNLQYYRYCKGVVILQEQLYLYLEMNPNSLEAKFKKNLFYNQKELYSEIKRFLVDQKAYYGSNVQFLSNYFVYRVFLCLHNLSNPEGKITFEESYYEIKKIVDDDDVRKCCLYCNVNLNSYDQYVFDLLIAKKYEEIHEILRKPEGLRNQLDTIHSIDNNAIIDDDPAFLRVNIIIKSYRWLKRTIRSCKKYGIAITIKRIYGKIIRFVKKG